MRKIILSSSANVYGESSVVPVTEGCETGIVPNPYGRICGVQEEMLRRYSPDDRWNIVILMKRRTKTVPRLAVPSCHGRRITG